MCIVRKKAGEVGIIVYIKAGIIVYIEVGIIVYIEAGIVGYVSLLPDKSHCLQTIDRLSGIARLLHLDVHW